MSEECLAPEAAFDISKFLNGSLHDVFSGSSLPESVAKKQTRRRESGKFILVREIHIGLHCCFFYCILLQHSNICYLHIRSCVINPEIYYTLASSHQSAAGHPPTHLLLGALAFLLSDDRTRETRGVWASLYLCLSLVAFSCLADESYCLNCSE